MHVNAARARDAGLLLGAALIVVGLAQGTFPWAQLAPRIAEFAGYALAVLAAGLLLARLTGRTPASATLAIGLSVAALWFAGWAAVAATALVLLGAMALGTFLPRGGLAPVVRWVAGLGLLAAVAGWLLPFPVHHPAAWAFGLGLLVLARREELGADFRDTVADLGGAMRASPFAAAAWAIVVILAAAPAWLPTRNADDLAYHINLGFELLRYGHGRLDIGTQAWALAPWSSDLPHALVTLLAGRDSPGPLNAALLVGVAVLTHQLARSLGLGGGRAWLASMLYMSLPLTSFLAGSLQTETITAPALVALALAIAGPVETRTARLPVVAVLAGLCMGAKISNALMLLPLAMWWVVAWARAFPWRALPVSVLLGAFTAGSSYVYATLLTGNPVVPMFNAVFRTPWFPPENFVDPTWQTGFGPKAFWGLVFETNRYFEGLPGAAGVVLVALVGGVFVGLVDRRVRPVLLVGLAGMLLVFFQVQYLRYFHPALALLVPALAAALLPQEGRWGWRELLVAAIVPLQLALAPTTSWMFTGGALRTLVTQGADAVNAQYVPERAISERLRAQAFASDRVLFVDRARSHGAELPGQSVAPVWFTPIMARAHDGQRTPATWEKVVERAGANHLLVYDLPAWPDVAEFLIEQRAVRVDANGAASLYWLPPQMKGAPPAGNAEAGDVVVDFPLDRPYPVLGQAVVHMACSEPGKPVAVAWTLPASPVQPMGHWEWVTCGPDGIATAAVEFQAGAGDGALRLEARPAQPEGGLAVRLLSSGIDLRRNYTAETALFHWVRRPFCGSDHCKGERPRVAPLATGPILLHTRPLPIGTESAPAGDPDTASDSGRAVTAEPQPVVAGGPER